MKAKHLSVAIAALLAAGGLWFAWSAWRTHATHKSGVGLGVKMPHESALDATQMTSASSIVGSQTPHGPNFDPNNAGSLPRVSQTVPDSGSNSRPQPAQMLNPPAQLAPPVPNRLFTDFTPEQRVQFARKRHGPGG